MSINALRALGLQTVLIGLASLQAAQPKLGGPMKHMLVTLSGTSIGVTLEGDPLARLWLYDEGETYSAPADVLNGTHYNGQYGWLAGGFISLPPGTAIWVELREQTPGLSAYEALTFDPLWGTDGASVRWKWNGVMVHNWYTANRCGKYQARYSVYVGDAVTGTPTTGYSPGECTLYWQYVPDEALGDLDADFDVDLHDFARLQCCVTGVGPAAMPAACGCVDFDGDDDVDAGDAVAFLAEYAGPGG